MSGASEWPVWEVGVYGFGDLYVEAPSKPSARWWVVSRMHEAGYGRSPIELIQRGVTVREISRTMAGIMGDIHRVKLTCPLSLPTPAQTASGVEPIVADIARRIANGELESQQ